MPTPAEQMKAVEDRVFAARLTMKDVLRIANVAESTWSRAKSRGTIRAKTLGRVEDAIGWYEKNSRQAAGEG
ncbi:hypothetical protein vBEliSR6L_35 [Erythrobacter phage vB_EliS_R6L]|nr:hypothetical protein vBEliSR6L_35 [Erythrobacter phage vB_EliS_R6L]